MKQVIKEEYVKKVTTTYVADDGKEFDEAYKCRQYEAAQNRKELDKKYERLLLGSFSFPFNDWLSESFHVDIVRMKNKDDYYTVEDYYSDTYVKDIKEPEVFPCNMVVYGDESYVINNITPDDIKKKLDDAMARFDKVYYAMETYNQ